MITNPIVLCILVACAALLAAAGKSVTVVPYADYGGETVSSSLAMMKEYAGFSEQDPGFVEIEAGRMPDWVIAPSTRLKDVRKALPTQYLRLGETVGAVHLERLDPARFKGLAKEEIFDRFTDAMCALLRSVAARHEDVVIPLTAGYDSRTLVALAHKAGIPFRTVSFTHKGISRADRKVPFEIARRLGFRHESIAPQREADSAAREAWESQTLGCCVSPDRDFLAFCCSFHRQPAGVQSRLRITRDGDIDPDGLVLPGIDSFVPVIEYRVRIVVARILEHVVCTPCRVLVVDIMDPAGLDSQSLGAGHLCGQPLDILLGSEDELEGDILSAGCGQGVRTVHKDGVTRQDLGEGLCLKNSQRTIVRRTTEKKDNSEG